MTHPHRLARALAAIVALLALTPALAEEITVATYNVENLFDRFDNPYKNDEQTEIKKREDLRRLAATIRAIDADVIGFQEIENEYVLSALNDELLKGMGYRHVVSLPSNDGRGITLGLLSRLPVLAATSHRWEHIPHRGAESTHRWARDLQRVTLALPDGQTLDFFNVHFKSRGSRPGDERSNGWRTAEATRAREIVNRILDDRPDALIAFVGDFNSEPTDPAARAFFDAQGPGTPLIDLLADVPAEEKSTYVFGNFPEAVFDYIAVSAALNQHLVPGSAKVMPKNAAARGSDHLPVVATFNIPAAP
ncbi:MAG: endonuclease/exonuclease/phosphatase family protein [Planctomycetota bacterium]